MKIAIAGATGLVGSRLTAVAEAAGHEVVGLSRSQGVDLTTGEGLDLSGVDALVDVTQPATTDPVETAAFFAAVGERLGAADVPRKVLLSIIGIEAAVDENPYYAAKIEHERAYAGRAHILRAAQFHDIARQMLGWNREGDAVTVPDLQMQPVAVPAVAAALLAMATGADDRPLVEIAGPRRETLPDLVARIAPAEVTVSSTPAGPAIAGGALRPGPDAIIAGPAFDEWLAAAA